MGLLQIIKMKACIILFCLLAVVYGEGVGDDKSLKEHMNLLEAKADDAKDVISSFFGNLLEPTSLKFLVAQVIEWFAWLLVTAILGQNLTHLPDDTSANGNNNFESYNGNGNIGSNNG